MFAQINYSQRLGNGPVTIHEAGCFLTAFCNLAQRFGENIDPPTLNNYFISHNDFLPEQYNGSTIHDLLAWSTISAYDSTITTVGTGGAGWPDSNDAIVKFVYGKGITHFCLVADHTQGTIVDSWDGVTKHSPYGTPVAWAKYERHTAQPNPAPAPLESPAYTIERIAERTEQLKVDAKLWNLNERTWPGLANNPVGSASNGTEFKTSAIAHHVLGGSYYMLDPNSPQGYNVVDCQDAPSEPKYTIIETYPNGRTVKLNKQPTHLWGMNYDFDYMVAHPVETHDQGEIVTVANKVHHKDGYDYYRRDGQIDGFNVADCDDYTPPSQTPPSGATPYPSPNEMYTVLVEVPGYTTSNQAVNRVGASSKVPADNYHVFNKRFDKVDTAKLIAINVTRQAGVPGSWINPDDNVKPAPAALGNFVNPREASPAPEPPAPVEPAPTIVAASTVPPAPVETEASIRASYQPFMPDGSPIDCQVKSPVLVTDRLHFGKELTLKPPDMVRVYGSFYQGGQCYALVKKKGDVNNYYMYGIAISSPTNLEPYLDDIYSVTDHLKYGFEKSWDKAIQTIDGIFRGRTKK